MHDSRPQESDGIPFRGKQTSQPGRSTRILTTAKHGTSEQAGLTFEVPSALQPYLTSATRPHETYAVLQDSRDRRLRRLLRRFTNQIQYGCVNPHCDIPTCFSFRRRSSQVPVRPYNDVTARSLAWRCVEDYANSGKPACASEDTISSQKKTGKGKYICADKKDGLCWNEPVVPWYQDPAEYLANRKATNSKRTAVGRKTRQNSSASPRKRSPVNLAPADGDSAYASRVQSGRASHIPSKHGQCDENHHESEASKRESDLSRNIDRDLEQSPDLGLTTTKQYSGRFETAEPPDIAQTRPKDRSSFPQRFYDTLCVKALEVPAPLSSGTLEPEAIKLAHEIHTRKQDGPSIENYSSYQRTIGSIQSVPTFRLLPTSALVWLRHVMARQSDRRTSTQPGIANETDDKTDLDRFAGQCLHFGLGNPHRLLMSAQMWRYNDSHRAVKRESSDTKALEMLEDVVANIASTEMLPVLSSPRRLPPMQDVVQAFALLARIQPYAEILDHLFAALQHAYVLPPSLKSSNSSAERIYANINEVNLLKNSTRTTKGIDSENISNESFLNDDQTADLCMLILIALFRGEERLGASPLSAGDKNTASSRLDYLICRDFGIVFPHAHLHHTFPKTTDRQWRSKYRAVLFRIDAHDNPSYLRLLESFADVLSHRLALTETLRTTKGNVSENRTDTVVDKIVKHLLALEEPFNDPGICHTAWLLLELMCLLLLKKWDRKPVVQRTSSVGGALRMMAALYRNRTQLGMPAVNFSFNFVADSFDCVKAPLEWLAFREDSKHIHMLSYSFLFDSATLVKYFRAINIEIMRKSYQYALLNQHDARRFLDRHHSGIPLYGGQEMLAALRPHMALYFVITAARSNLVEDAINQIWRRQRQELMRPLKVVLGKGEGEDGLDHGGVQQEFFRLVFAEALNPDYGMFTVDDRTRMTWFQPGSLEPLYKFEAMGILMSLAVYNAITLPVTFPLAFYRKLLGLKVKQLDHIEDGWPELVKGLTILRDWDDGDVGDVIARTYEFSYEAFGSNVTIDMTRVRRDDHWPPMERRKSKDRVKTATFELFRHDIPTPPSETEHFSEKLSPRPFRLLRTSSHDFPRSPTPLSILSSNTSLVVSIPSSPGSPAPLDEAPLVTNANRNKYIKDYIFWLTNKSISPQYEAFARGFHTCLDPIALSIFTPEALKSVVEGYTEIDIDGLEAAATYDDYRPDEEIIKDFWSVVRDFSPEQHKQLLEFVTASERVPVNGIKSVTFLIQRNGVGDDRLPSSATCYGRLLLPRYSSREILKEKLAKAIENSVGFGSL